MAVGVGGGGGDRLGLVWFPQLVSQCVGHLCFVSLWGRVSIGLFLGG